MNITGTHIHYYFVCHRKLWLFSNGLTMEHTSDLVADGRLIHDTSYPQRSEKYTELTVGPVKIDYYDSKNKVIHEIKRTDAIETAHEWQLKYYIHVLGNNGIEGVTGILEYPKLKHRSLVELTLDDTIRLEEVKKEIEKIMDSQHCPERVQMKLCKKCAYYDFCWSGEDG